MIKHYPGTTIEVSELCQGCSRALFDGIFATGGITLSQVCLMTGLEPYMVQNWVKRGFLTSPKKRIYSKSQFARIIIINMLKESLQIEKICGFVQTVGGVLDDDSDDLISDDELYHRYVDMLSDDSIDMRDPESVLVAAEKIAQGFEEHSPGESKKLVRILQVMLYAHFASGLRTSANEILSSLQ